MTSHNLLEKNLPSKSPPPDGELRYPESSHNEDLSKSTEKFKINEKKQRKSSSSHSISSTGNKKLKLSEDEADKPKSSNFNPADKPNATNELDESEGGTVDKNNISKLLHRHDAQCLHPLLQIKKHEITMNQIAEAIAEDYLNRTRRRQKLPIRGGKKLSSMNAQKETIESSGSASPNQTTKAKEKMASMNTTLISPESATPKQTTKEKGQKTLKNTILESSAAPKPTTKAKEKKTSKNTTLKISGSAAPEETTKEKEKEKKTLKNTTLTISGSAAPEETTKEKDKKTLKNTTLTISGSAAPEETTEEKEKKTLKNTTLTISGSAAPEETTKGKEKKILRNTSPTTAGSALKHLFDLETIMRDKLAAANAAVNAATSWKGANTQSSSPMDCTGQEKDTSNSTSNLESVLALGSTPSSGNISTITSRTYSGFQNYKDKDDDWSELELEALLSFVKKYGIGNWHVKFGDPDLQIIRNKTAKELADKWEMVGFKMLPYLPNSSMLPVTADRSTPHASQGNRVHSIFDRPPIQFPSEEFPIHRPTPRLGIPPLHVPAGNQALDWGMIKPPSNDIFRPHFQGSSSGAFHSLPHFQGSSSGAFHSLPHFQGSSSGAFQSLPHFQGSSSGAFHSLPPLATAHPSEMNANLNTMNPELLAQFRNERPNLLTQNFGPMSFQTPQIPPLSLSATTISPPANVGTEARPQFALGGSVLLPDNWILNKNAGQDTDNSK